MELKQAIEMREKSDAWLAKQLNQVEKYYDDHGTYPDPDHRIFADMGFEFWWNTYLRNEIQRHVDAELEAERAQRELERLFPVESGCSYCGGMAMVGGIACPQCDGTGHGGNNDPF